MTFQGEPIASFARLRTRPWPARSEILTHRDRRLRRVVEHAGRHVPHYRRLFSRTRLRPGDVRGVADLGRIPLTSRGDLADLPAGDVVASGIDPERLIRHRTSGSTGEPLTIRRTWWEERLLNAYRCRAERSWGLGAGTRHAVVALARPPVGGARIERLMRRSGILRRHQVDCLAAPGEILRTLRRLRPDHVVGFPGVLARLAEEDPSERRGIRPRQVTVGGEVTTPAMRRRIREAFEAPVRELYACVECHVLAWECAATGNLHTCDDGVILEVLRDGEPVGPGERGEVVVTALHSLAMPFIRYRLGDVVTRGPDLCACGRPFGTIRNVLGRMLDHFPLPGGRVVHPWEITVRMIGEEDWLRQYQLTQERRDSLVLHAVARRPPTPAEAERLARNVADVVGEGVSFRLRLVPDLAPGPNGKFRISRSLVRSGFDGHDAIASVTDRDPAP